MERNHLSELQAQERIASQMPLDEKRAHADLVLDNNGDLAALYVPIRCSPKTIRKEDDFITREINWRKIYIYCLDRVLFIGASLSLVVPFMALFVEELGVTGKAVPFMLGLPSQSSSVTSAIMSPIWGA